MSREWMEGFEDGLPNGDYFESTPYPNFWNDSYLIGTPETIRLEKGRSIYSKYCLKIDGTNINSQRFIKVLPSSLSSLYLRSYFKFCGSELNDAMTDVISLRRNDNHIYFSLYNRSRTSSTGEFSIAVRVGGSYLTRYIFDLLQDTWYNVEVFYDKTGTYTVWINGMQLYTETGLSLETDDVERIFFRGSSVSSETGHLWNVFFDDIAVNSTAGSVNNGRCGSGTILSLKPSSQGDYNDATSKGFAIAGEGTTETVIKIVNNNGEHGLNNFDIIYNIDRDTYVQVDVQSSTLLHVYGEVVGQRVGDRIIGFKFQGSETAEAGTDNESVTITGNSMNSYDVMRNSAHLTIRRIIYTDGDKLYNYYEGNLDYKGEEIEGQTNGDTISLYKVHRYEMIDKYTAINNHHPNPARSHLSMTTEFENESFILPNLEITNNVPQGVLIHAVSNNFYASGAGGELKSLIGKDSSFYFSTNTKFLQSNTEQYQTIYNDSSFTGVAWTTEELKKLQIGFRSNTNTIEMLISDVSLQVEIDNDMSNNVIQHNVDLEILCYTSLGEAQTGTDSNNIVIPDHNLKNDDFIINLTKRSDVGDETYSRRVKVLNTDTLYVPAILDMTSTDYISLFKFTNYNDKLIRNSLDIQLSAESDDAFSFDLIHSSTSTLVKIGQYARVFLDDNLRSTGIITDITTTKKNNRIYQNVNVSNLKLIPPRRTIEIVYTANTVCGDIAEDMANILIEDGVEIGLIEDGGFVSERWMENAISVSDVLDKISTNSGYQWFIDKHFRLNFCKNPNFIETCTLKITPTGTFKDYRNFSIKEDVSNYINHIQITGSKSKYGNPLVLDIDAVGKRNFMQDKTSGTGIYGHIVRDIGNNSVRYLEADINTSNIMLNTTTPHGLEVGDMIHNATRKIDTFVTAVNNSESVQVTPSVTGQAEGDDIITLEYLQEIGLNILNISSNNPEFLEFDTFQIEIYPQTILHVHKDDLGQTETKHYNIEDININEVNNGIFITKIKASLRDIDDYSTAKSPKFIEFFKGV